MDINGRPKADLFFQHETENLSQFADKSDFGLRVKNEITRKKSGWLSRKCDSNLGKCLG